MKPLIGITSGTIYNAEFPFYPFTYGQMHTYVEAVAAAGGTPVIIPIGKTVGDAKEILGRLDGILFSGGNDISPKLYGEEPKHIEDRGIDELRDNFESELMRQSLAVHKPVLAICRGMQLLNVVRGGTLYQDILSQIPTANKHEGRLITEDFQHLAHRLALAPESRLAKILGAATIGSNTHHHQAVNIVGDNLVVSAHAEDGIIEGVEDTNEKFVVGVQSHPESLAAEGGSDWQLLFDAFVEAAKSKS